MQFRFSHTYYLGGGQGDRTPAPGNSCSNGRQSVHTTPYQDGSGGYITWTPARAQRGRAHDTWKLPHSERRRVCSAFLSHLLSSNTFCTKVVFLISDLNLSSYILKYYTAIFNHHGSPASSRELLLTDVYQGKGTGAGGWIGAWGL